MPSSPAGNLQEIGAGRLLMVPDQLANGLGLFLVVLPRVKKVVVLRERLEDRLLVHPRFLGIADTTAVVMTQRISEDLAVLNKSGAFRQLVIERTSNRIALVGKPIDAARARRARLLLYCLDQGAAKATLTHIVGDEQGLQVAIVADGPARAVEKIVHDACELAVHVGPEHTHWLLRIVEPRPGDIVGLPRHRGLVEGEIAGPEALPVRALFKAHRADDGLRHQSK